jgi:hypothetical protein
MPNEPESCPNTILFKEVELNIIAYFIWNSTLFYKDPHNVPEVIIPENCRLDNKIYTGPDFFDQ